MSALIFPTDAHRQASDAIVDLYSRQSPVQAVLIVNSCARGVATPESDLDVALLIDPDAGQTISELEADWRAIYARHPAFAAIKQLGQFTGVHLDFFDGRWLPEIWDDGGGPDIFEIEIGNRVAYAVPVWERAAAFATLRATWLPYYDRALQLARLTMVQDACRHNLDRLRFYVQRGLYFQAFDRLYHAFQEFLQALFIARRTYPIAYNKWIRAQIVDGLQLPALYAELPVVFEIGQFESQELVTKGRHVLRLLEDWVTP